VVNFTTIACRISSRLKWYKNYNNRLILDKVIVKNQMSHFYGSLCIVDRAVSSFHWFLPAVNIGRSFQLKSSLLVSCFTVCVHLMRGRPTFLLPPCDHSPSKDDSWHSSHVPTSAQRSFTNDVLQLSLLGHFVFRQNQSLKPWFVTKS